MVVDAINCVSTDRPPIRGRDKARPHTHLLFPLQRAFHRALPASVEPVALAGAHLRLEGAVNGPVLCDLLRAAPETNSDTREVSGTKRCCLRYLWSLDRYAKDVGLELHQQVIDDRTTIDAQRLKADATIGFHSLEYITGPVPASASTSTLCLMTPSPSRSHCTAAPVMKIAPSRA